MFYATCAFVGTAPGLRFCEQHTQKASSFFHLFSHLCPFLGEIFCKSFHRFKENTFKLWWIRSVNANVIAKFSNNQENIFSAVVSVVFFSYLGFEVHLLS